MVSFLLSVITNYIHDYEKAVARQYMRLRQGLPENCMERESTWKSVFKTLLTYMFVISSEGNDECMAYSKAIVIDPLFEVTPMNAFTTTVSKLVLTPVNLIAESVNNVFRTMLEGVPPVLIPVFLGVILYMFTLILFCRYNYTMSVPWLVDVKPMIGVGSKRCDDGVEFLTNFLRDDGKRVVTEKKDVHHHHIVSSKLKRRSLQKKK